MTIAEPSTPPTSASRFVAAYPSYAKTQALDALRAKEYPALASHTYLDFTAANLYATSQLARHHELLQRTLVGNPHSTNPSSSTATEFVARARRAVLRFFNASPDDWDVVFTGNASLALKMVGESYPFGPGDRFLLTFDNHNSVNGIREFVRAASATATYVPVVLPEMRVDEGDLARGLATANPDGHNLFAYPAQSNFSGVQHPLEWIARAQAQGWDVLLDAAAFTATNRLDLGRWHPDFVVQSFYKLFGYPTGVGCLLARKTALGKLRRAWAGFEDGTPDYLAMPAIEIGLQHVESLGIDLVHERVRCLTGWLLDELLALQQTNGTPLVRLYGPPAADRRGGIVTFNFHGTDGHAIDHRVVAGLASEAGISLRTHCFCNPGAGDGVLDVTGAVRVSLGMVSNVADVDRFIAFAKGFIGQ